MPTATQSSPSARPIAGAISRTRARWLAVKLAEGLLLLGLFVAAVVLVAFALDNLLHLGSGIRLGITLAFTAGFLYLLVRYVAPYLVAQPTDEEVALIIERHNPDLENRLINALQLRRMQLEPAGVSFAQILWEDASHFITRVDLDGVVNRRTLRKLALVLPLPILALVAYGLAFPAHFANAFQRYAHPASFVAPITRTTLTVTPGNATVLKGDALAVKALAGGELPTGATLRVWGAEGTTAHEMLFAGDAFAFTLENVASPFSYRIDAGDAESDTFRVSVVERPRVVGIAVEYRFPDYTGLPPRTEDPSSGEITALVGSRAVVTARANKPLDEAALVLADGTVLPGKLTARDRFSIELAVDRKDRYRFQVKDADGFTDKDSPTYPITPIEDRPPTVEVREPGRNLTLAPDGELSLAVRAKDDFGVKSVSVHLAREGVSGETELAAWPYKGTDREVNSGTVLKLATQKLKPGDTLRYYAKAKDSKGQETTSRSFTVTIATSQAEKAKLVAGLAGILDRLRQILEQQKKAQSETDRLKGRLAAAPPARVAQDAKALSGAQAGIRESTLALLKDWQDPTLARAAARERLAALAADEMAKVLDPLAALGAAKDAPGRTAAADAALALQAKIVKALQEILDETRKLLDELKQGDVEQVIAAQEKTSTKDKLKEVLDGLRDFAKAQQKVIDATQELSKKKPEDFSSEDKKELADLKATEEKWGKFLEEAGTDLSKIPPQDFSNSSISKELLEAYSEVEQAAKAVDQKKIEMAVPLEQSGLELAKSITANIERWLSDVPDNLKWNMEEPTKDYDVPMADLPEELEDLIGDLIDQEDQMNQDTQDVTSSWMDSINEGAGWTAADGPISNMSAKGITGNMQPNSQEVGGRSGEGRSGKSSGQMVEETASGKGGKQTPSRSTPDPFEAGKVKDSSKDPTGGSTGGGKVSGVNAEGLRGAAPPPVMEKMDRLKTQQAEVRNKAEKLDVTLEKRHYYSEDLKKAIEQMKQLEADLARYKGDDYVARRKQIAEKLAALRKVIDAQMRSNRDATSRLPKELRDEILNALDEEAPSEYKELVKDYYRSLSEGK